MESKSIIAKMPDVQLLEQLCSIDDDKQLYSAFVSRFLSDIQENCLKICNIRKLDSHIGQQIAHETFERVRKYKSYKRDGSKLPNDRKAILVYLKRISVRLFNDHYNKEKRKDICHQTYFDNLLEEAKTEVDAAALKNKKDLALLIFSKLNKKEQAVVIKDLEYKKHHKYLPDDVTTALAAELKVKPDTIRKIRARAIEKIKIAIDEVNKI
jgi:DNA-directed RNA polymerase specialized sigma24 family protein